MDTFRFVCYVVGLLEAVGVAFALLRLRSGLGRLLGLAMIVWAVNCASFGMMLGYKMWIGDTPAWSSQLWTVNAFLLAIMPGALYMRLWRNGENG